MCCELKEAKLPFGLRLNWLKLAALIFPPLVPLLPFSLSLAIKLSISFSFSCSSFRKKSTSILFSFLICSLMSLGMSGIIQSTRTLRNITKFYKHSNRHETSVKNQKYTRSKPNFFYSYEANIKHILLMTCNIKQLSKALVQETAHVCEQHHIFGDAKLNTCFN